MTPVAPAAQLVARQALAQALDVKVSTQMPTNRPQEHVIISRIAGRSPTFGTNEPRFLVEVYATTELAAETLAEKVHAAWLSLRTHEIIHSSSDYNLVPHSSPDPDHHRFQFTGGLTLKLAQQSHS